MKGYRTCRRCDWRKPLSEFDGAERRCRECIEARVPTTTKNQRNRARNRAYAELARRHKEEFTELYDKEMELMRTENGIAEVMAGLR